MSQEELKQARLMSESTPARKTTMSVIGNKRKREEEEESKNTQLDSSDIVTESQSFLKRDSRGMAKGSLWNWLKIKPKNENYGGHSVKESVNLPIENYGSYSNKESFATGTSNNKLNEEKKIKLEEIQGNGEEKEPQGKEKENKRPVAIKGKQTQIIEKTKKRISDSEATRLCDKKKKEKAELGRKKSASTFSKFFSRSKKIPEEQQNTSFEIDSAVFPRIKVEENVELADSVNISYESFRPLEEVLHDGKSLPKSSNTACRLKELSNAEIPTSVSGRILETDPLETVSPVPDDIPYELQMEQYIERVNAHSKKKWENRECIKETVKAQKTRYIDQLSFLKSNNYFPHDSELLLSLESAIQTYAEVEKNLE
ncbi:uncharacterized protein LOC135844436 [Planococcus citri]|uniref:uncharacterized protein LOC135844436 n=1 Tax=Planococcus citri TaxID=170843 RepID=UPI0031F998CC